MLRVAFGLLRHGVEVHAAFPQAAGTSSMITDCEASGVIYWPFDYDGDSLISRCRQVRKLLKDVRPDVVQLTAGWPTEVIEPALACALMSVPMLAIFQLAREPIVLAEPRLKRLAWARSRQQQWMAVSQNNLSSLQHTFRMQLGEMGVLYNGIEIPSDNYGGEVREILRREVRAELGIPVATRILLTTSRLDPQKGHADLLQIGRGLIDRFSDICFVWAGDGLAGDGKARERLETEIQKRGLQDHFRLLGYRTDIERLIHASDLFVFPSHFEGGCSSSVREAMVHRLPIVCSDAGGIPEILIDGRHALLFPAHDTGRMLSQLSEALNQPARMRTLAENGRKRIEEFSSERMVETYLAAFRKLTLRS